MLIGVIGKANVGKSTFFKALTLAEVLIANYPFATIKPNRGFGFARVRCVDKEFGVQCNPRTGYCVNGTRFVPVELLDVAGLVPGAHAGKGMGNQFLDDLRQADAFIHVIDIAGTTNEKGEPVQPGSYDPAYDIQFLEEELDLWYCGILKKGWDKLARQAQQEKLAPATVLGKQLSGLNVKEELIQEQLKKLDLLEKQPTQWTEKEILKLASELRKKTKPMIVAANKIDLPTGKKNYEKLCKQFPDYKIIPCSAESELALKEAAKHGYIEYLPGDDDFKILKNLNEKQKQAMEYIKTNVLDKHKGTGVQKAVETAVFELLNFMAVFPAGVNKLADQHGNILPDCFLMPPATTAQEFAYKIHQDLGKHFIRAIDVKTKKTVGKEHLLKHRDMIEIISGK